jgi:hypothetical protein
MTKDYFPESARIEFGRLTKAVVPTFWMSTYSESYQSGYFFEIAEEKYIKFGTYKKNKPHGTIV